METKQFASSKLVVLEFLLIAITTVHARNFSFHFKYYSLQINHKQCFNASKINLRITVQNGCDATMQAAASKLSSSICLFRMEGKVMAVGFGRHYLPF